MKGEQGRHGNSDGGGIAPVPAVFCACARCTFSHSVVMSVADSELGCTQLIFVKPGRKIGDDYYRDEPLMELLTASRPEHRTR